MSKNSQWESCKIKGWGVIKPDKFLLLFVAIGLLVSFLHTSAMAPVSAQSGEVLFVTFMNVGQGDSSLLSTSTGVNILIDAGPQSAGQRVTEYLLDQGVTLLDVVVLSHNHADHIGGLVDVLQSAIHIENILYNGNSCTTFVCQNVWSGMEARGIIPVAVKSGDSFQWDSVSAEILNPQPIPANNENEDSVVMDILFFDTRLLYTGDIGFSTESLLINQGVLYSTDVLKVAHHGSAYSTSTSFLDAVNPQYAVISVGDNSYGHPSLQTINRLESVGANILRTDQGGNISFTFYGLEPNGDDVIMVYIPLIIMDSSLTPPP